MSERGRFILYRGVLGWGIPVWILHSLFMVWQDTREFGGLRRGLVVLYLAGPPLWLLGGYCWGRWMWSWMERRKLAAVKVTLTGQ